jgi:hypothetical protein
MLMVKPSQRSVITWITAMLLLFAAGCAAEPGLDKGKFLELSRAGQDLQVVLGSVKICEVPDTVLQRLASGTAALKDKTASKSEADLLAAYANLIAIIEDGMLLCRSRSHLSGFEFVPKGRIYVTQELDPLVEKYGLPTESHVYKPTGAHWKSISADSITVIRERAEVQIKKIDVLLKYS